MSIIRDTISQYLDKGYATNVIVTGLDGSGKTYMIKELICKYMYKKSDGAAEITVDNTDYLYQLIDRHQLIDWYVYTHHSDSTEFDNKYFEFMNKKLKKLFVKPLFVFYLHGMFMEMKPNEPEFVIKDRELIYNNYIKIIKGLDKYKYPMIVITKNSFFLKNGIYDIYNH